MVIGMRRRGVEYVRLLIDAQDNGRRGIKFEFGRCITRVCMISGQYEFKTNKPKSTEIATTRASDDQQQLQKLHHS